MSYRYVLLHPNGNKSIERYKLNGKLHRDPLEGPAFIKYYKNGQKEFERYYLNDKRHNPYGPAIIYYDHDIYQWWFNGINYTKEVNEYLDKQGLIWHNMYHYDFDIIWVCIL